jgi:integrase
LPTFLPTAQVQKALDGCDRATPTGRRDYAILMMLAKLGLRADEVATLTLDDIDWRASELLVRAKGRQRARMPIPPDVGKAIVAYLRNGWPRAVMCCAPACKPQLGSPSMTPVRGMPATTASARRSAMTASPGSARGPVKAD